MGQAGDERLASPFGISVLGGRPMVVRYLSFLWISAAGRSYLRAGASRSGRYNGLLSIPKAQSIWRHPPAITTVFLEA